jgi:cytoskeletal protein CcmA (bactofilin family)
VVGDLTTARIMIEHGAYFKGSIEIDRHGETGGEKEKDLDKPAYARAASTAPATAVAKPAGAPNASTPAAKNS